MSRVRLVVATALLAVFAAPAGFADEVGVRIEFSKDEIRIISAWYRDHGPDARHGDTGRQKGLPPGIAKNLALGKPLPPGIAKQYLPDDLRDALPQPPKGYERIIVDGRVLLVEIATRVIHDILTDVIVD